MKRINIVNEGEKFNKKKYEGALGDYDKDGLANIDDANPYTSEKNPQKVEQIELAKTFEKLLTLKNQLDDTMDITIGELDTIAPKGSLIYARTKTPYSILKKLVEKRLTDKQRGLTDLVGTTIVVDDLKDLRKVDKAIKKGEIGKVVEREDMYKNPKGGYRAIHYLVEVDGYIVEVQLKTKRQKAINEQSHEAYKKGTLNSEYLLYVTDLANKADKGNRKAYIEFDKIIDNPTQLAKDLDTSFEFGGEITRNYDVNVKSGVGTYAQGGELFDADTEVQYAKGGMTYPKMSIEQVTKLVKDKYGYLKSISRGEFEIVELSGQLHFYADDREKLAKDAKQKTNEYGVSPILEEISDFVDSYSSKELMPIMAKGGKIEYYKDGEPILDTMEKEKMLKPLDDYGYYLKIGNVTHYYDDNKNWETSKFGFAKGGDVFTDKSKEYAKNYTLRELDEMRDRLLKTKNSSKVQKENLMAISIAMGIKRNPDYYKDFANGGSVAFEEFNPSYPFAKGGWIQDATAEMEKKGTIGTFTAKAKRYGMTPQEFAKKVLADDGKTNYTLKTKRQAQFMKNANPEMFSDGGEINRSYDVNINSGVGTYATGGVTEAGDVDFPSQMLNYGRGGTTKREVLVELYRSVVKLEKLRKEDPNPSEYIDYILKVKTAIRDLSFAYDDFYQFKSSRYAEGGDVMPDISALSKGKVDNWLNPSINTAFKDGGGDVMPDASSMDGYAKGGRTDAKVYNVAIRRKKDGYGMDLLPFDVTKSQAEKIAKNINGMTPNSAKAEIPLPFAKGGKTQGYNSRLDESLAERDGAERSFEQKKKDRRDESKAMEKAKGKRAYSSVKSMDKNDRFNFSFTDDFFKGMSSAPKPMKKKKRKK